MAKDKAAGAPPDHASLHEAALRYLGRFSATEAGLRRVLERRVQRWARERAHAAEAGQPAIADGALAAALSAAVAVARALAATGVVDDAAFAAARAARLARGGRSRRATAAHLAAKGIAADVAAFALPAPEADLSAAAVHARKRRLGPFRAEQTSETRLKDLTILARAGFPREVAEHALALELADAEALVLAARRGS